MARTRRTSAPEGVAPTPPGVAHTQQPVREIPAARHGDRQATTELQGAAPMAVGPTPAAQGLPQPPPNDVFLPTERPSEPDTAGIPFGPGANGPQMLPEEPDMLLRAMLSVFPDPDLMGLIRGG